MIRRPSRPSRPSRAARAARPARVPRVAVALATGALLAAGCSGAPAGSSDGPQVVATTTIWGDIASQVLTCAGGGDVEVLMPVGADPHDFAASSEALATIVGADLVLANGLGLEEGLASALESARSDGANVLELAPLLDPLPFGGEHDEADADHADEAGVSLDPHVWLDATRAARAAGLIGDTLAQATGDQAFGECGGRVGDELTDLHAAIATTLAEVPQARRILVTDHDAFGYFAAAYGYTVAATVIPGGSTLSKPSSAEMARLVTTIRETGVPAIFSNTTVPEALVEALAGEVGDVEVVPLFEASLGGPGSGAETYQAMMTTNAGRISAALAG